MVLEAAFMLSLLALSCLSASALLRVSSAAFNWAVSSATRFLSLMATLFS